MSKNSREDITNDATELEVRNEILENENEMLRDMLALARLDLRRMTLRAKALEHELRKKMM